MSTAPANPTRNSAPPALNPFALEFFASRDPYPLLAELRAVGPVLWVEQANCWAVTGYKAGAELLNQRKLRFLFDLGDAFDEAGASMFMRTFRQLNLVSTKGEQHTRVKQLFAGLMIPKEIEGLREPVVAATHRLLDEAESVRRLDIVSLGRRIQFDSISEVLAMPENIRSQGMRWMEQIMEGVRDITYEFNDEATLSTANDAVLAVNACFEDLIADRRRQPRDDMLDRMIRVADRVGATEEELLVNAWGLYIAGVETTATALGWAVWRLYERPGVLDELRADPTLLKSFIQEAIRYDVGFFITGRHVDEDMLLGGHLIRAGEKVILFIGAANHDPEQFPDPDWFNIRRNARSISFGNGPHQCVGQLLTRLVMETAVSTILERIPTFQLDTLDPERRPAMSGGIPALWGCW